MSEQADVTRLATDMSQALGLLKSSRALYGELLAAVRDNVTDKGEADIESLLARFNAALTGFARRDLEIKRLLARYGAEGERPGESRN